MRPAKLALLTAALFAAFAASAQAGQRYAAVGASGPEPCATGAPCSLAQAVKGAKEGDEVIVGAGTYVTAETLAPTGLGADIFIHGDFAGPMPRIDPKDPNGTALANFGQRARLSYLWLTSHLPAAPAAVCGEAGVLERVRAEASGDFAAAIAQNANCLVRDSLAISTGKGGSGLSATGSFIGSYTPIARNVTAIASGPESTGVIVSCPACFIASSIVLDLKNAIVGGAGVDIQTSESPTTSTTVLVGNSNFDKVKAGTPGSVVDKGGNQSTAPAFANAGAGDYAEAAGSPTIDAGVVDPDVGALDLAGNPRTQGGTIDIGAYEFAPPPPPPSPVGEVQSLSVSPPAFRTANAGEAILSAGGKKKKAAITATVTYSLSVAATAAFTVERKVVGRKVGKRCVKATKANRAKKRCTTLKPVSGGFSHSGAAGSNSFEFSGRIGGRALKPGTYSLTASVADSARTAGFKIVK